MAQIINITSEALQATIRRLLPSQQGFGEDLQATNVVTPIIDLTPTAEGSVLPESLQQSLNFGGQTAVVSQNNIVDVTSTTGFHRLTGTITVLAQSATLQFGAVQMTDGVSTKVVFNAALPATGASTAAFSMIDFDKIFFVDAGETLQVNTSSVSRFDGSVRQIATKNGTLVNPVGFTFE